MTDMEEPGVATQEEVTPFLTADEELILQQLFSSGQPMRHKITNPYPTYPPTGPIVVSDFTGLADATGVNAYESLTRWHAQGEVNGLALWTDGVTQAWVLTILGQMYAESFGGTHISSLTPSSSASSATNVALEVTGKGFSPTSEINFNGAVIATTFVDSGHLTATIATVPATAGNVPVLVQDSVSGFKSNTLEFVVT
jgi:hypothetical protein